jgi:hypothetical protein
VSNAFAGVPVTESPPTAGPSAGGATG